MENWMLRFFLLFSVVVLPNCEGLKRTVISQYDFNRCVEENSVSCAESALSRWYALPSPKTLEPLLIASKHNFIEMAGFLISKGADPNEKTIRGITAVHVAAMYGRLEMLNFLLEKNGDPSIREKSGANAFDMAVSVLPVLHKNPSEASKLRGNQVPDGAIDEKIAKKIGAEYLECVYLLAERRLSLANETITVIENFKNDSKIKPNVYTPYFEAMYKYLQDRALLKPVGKG